MRETPDNVEVPKRVLELIGLDVGVYRVETLNTVRERRLSDAPIELIERADQLGSL